MAVSITNILIRHNDNHSRTNVTGATWLIVQTTLPEEGTRINLLYAPRQAVLLIVVCPPAMKSLPPFTGGRDYTFTNTMALVWRYLISPNRTITDSSLSNVKLPIFIVGADKIMQDATYFGLEKLRGPKVGAITDPIRRGNCQNPRGSNQMCEARSSRVHKARRCTLRMNSACGNKDIASGCINCGEPISRLYNHQNVIKGFGMSRCSSHLDKFLHQWTISKRGNTHVDTSLVHNWRTPEEGGWSKQRLLPDHSSRNSVQRVGVSPPPT